MNMYKQTKNKENEVLHKYQRRNMEQKRKEERDISTLVNKQYTHTYINKRINDKNEVPMYTTKQTTQKANKTNKQRRSISIKDLEEYILERREKKKTN